jgi:transcriptional regulator with XRE-family HTH domain
MRTTTYKTAKKRLATRREFVPNFWLWIAMNILDRRLAAGLTQQRLAQQAGISLRRLHSIETCATKDVKINTIVALADVLGTDLRDLLKPRKDYIRV